MTEPRPTPPDSAPPPGSERPLRTDACVGSDRPGHPVAAGARHGSADPMLRWFRAVAVVEAVSYLCLVAASIVKRVTESTNLVPVIGPVHGVIFLVYLGLALLLRERLGWHLSTTLAVVVASVIPLGGVVVEQRLAHDDRSTA